MSLITPPLAAGAENLPQGPDEYGVSKFPRPVDAAEWGCVAPRPVERPRSFGCRPVISASILTGRTLGACCSTWMAATDTKPGVASRPPVARRAKRKID